MNSPGVITPLRFEDLNPVGRAIIVVVAILTAGVAAASFATSYGALYAFIRDAALYSDRLARLWPLLLDAAFIIAQLAAILGKILRGSRAWPILTMFITGGLTVWFNLQHAGADPGRRLAAVIPPALMILAFETDVAIVKWVMAALGRPLEQAPLAGTMLAPQTQMPTWAPSTNGQIGQGWGSGGVPAGAGTKRARVEAYLDAIGAQRALELGPGKVTADLKEDGLEVTERYVRDIMGTLPSTNGKGH